MKSLGTEAIQAIVVSSWKKDFNLKGFSEWFSKMSNLRLLIIYTMDNPNDRRHLALSSEKRRHPALPNNLRYLQWRDCPFNCLASSDEQPMEFQFAHLELRCGDFEYLWEGVMVILFFLIVFLLFFIISLFFFILIVATNTNTLPMYLSFLLSFIKLFY